MSKHKTPQEKKRDSLVHDRRNVYGENSKAARRAIPLRKAWAERAHRKSVHQALQAAHVVTKDDETLEAVEEKVASTAVKLLDRFEKVPDMPLGAVLAERKSKGGAPNAKHLRRIRTLESAVESARAQLKEAKSAVAAMKRATRERGSPATGEAVKLEELRPVIAKAKDMLEVQSSRLEGERRALEASTAKPIVGEPRR